MIYGGSSWGVKIDFFEKVLGSTGDLLGRFLCDRLSFWRGSGAVLGTFFPAVFELSETAGNGPWADSASALAKYSIGEIKIEESWALFAVAQAKYKSAKFNILIVEHQNN